MKKHSNHSKIYKINGVGVDLSKFYPSESPEKRDEERTAKGFSTDDFILLYTAEFIPRKNHKLLFDILPALKENIPSLKVILCGKGELLEYYQEYAATNGLSFVTFTGYTKEVAEYCRISDILFMPSHQEGLSIGMVEAIATGLPVVCSSIRGHVDVIEDGINGILCDNANPDSFVQATLTLYGNPELRHKMAENNISKASLFTVEKAVEAMAEIYANLM